jgi:hypothetical protein
MRFILLLALLAGCGNEMFAGATGNVQASGDGGAFVCVTRVYRRGRLFEGGSATVSTRFDASEYLVDADGGEPMKIGDACTGAAAPGTDLPDGGKLVIEDSVVSRLDAGGTVVWKVPLPHGRQGLVTADDRHVFVLGDERLTRLSLADGSRQWDRDLSALF